MAGSIACMSESLHATCTTPSQVATTREIDQWLTGWMGIDDGGTRSESDKTGFLGRFREDDEAKLVVQQLIRICLEAAGTATRSSGCALSLREKRQHRDDAAMFGRFLVVYDGENGVSKAQGEG
uniref:Uncharacterized protein n=1 Tax=Oryza barthii TaxID=65489 RepID=A0A0D3F4L4_9ORYZ